MLNLLLLKLLIVGSVEAVQSVDLVSTIKAVDCEYSLFCVSVARTNKSIASITMLKLLNLL